MKIDNFSIYLQQKQMKLSFEDRKFELDNNFIMYFSKGEYINHNGSVESHNEIPIVCKDFSYFQLRFEKDYNKRLETEELIKSEEFLMDNICDKEEFDFRADSYNVFNIENLGDCLYSLCKDMKVGDKKSIKLSTVDHAMSITVKFKNNPNRFIIKFYDPNKTIVHKRLVVENSIEMQQINISNFVDEEEKDLYFKNETAIFMVYNNPNDASNNRHEPKIINTNHLNNISKGIFFFFWLNDPVNLIIAAKQIINDNKLNFVEKIKILEAKQYDDRGGLNIAILRGQTESVSSFIKELLDSKLTNQEKFELLSAKDTAGTHALFYAFFENHIKIIIVAVEKILKSPLSNSEKVELLSATHIDGTFGLSCAIDKGYSEIVFEYINKIIGSSLTRQEKFKLIKGRVDEFRNTALCNALFKGFNKTVEVYMSCILEANLTDLEKVELLQVIDDNGENSLYVVAHNEQPETVALYIKLILHSKLSNIYKINLVLAQNTNGTPILAYILSSNCDKYLIQYISIILESSLTNKEIIELFLIKDKDDCIALDYIIVDEDYVNILETFKECILNSKSLNQQEKNILLDSIYNN